MTKYKLDYDKPQSGDSAILEVARALNNIANEMDRRNDIENRKLNRI